MTGDRTSHWRRRATAGLLLAACFILEGCHGSEPAGHERKRTARPVAVIVSCDTAGWIVPCGCSSKQAGGLPRRASYLKQVQQSADVLLVDAGGGPGGSSAYDRLKFEFLLRGEIAMGTTAHNIGDAEAALGPDRLRDLIQNLKAPFISSNLLDAEGKPVAPSHTIASVGGRRFAVLGVLSRKYVRDNLKIEDPREALMRLIRSLSGQYDSLLVLAYLPEDELQTLVNQIPEADMIVGGPTRQAIAPKRAGPSIWGATTNKGKFLVRLDQPAPTESWSGKIVELDDQFADDAAQLSNLTEFRAELARLDFPADQTSFVPNVPVASDAKTQVAGTEACRECHADDCQQWSSTKHAHAWATLVEKQAQMDPYCQHCHTTAYGLPGGFQSASSGTSRHDVGCESCHGPALAHSLRPAIHTLYDARDRCARCHDHENSPTFQYDEFWNQIAHGVVSGKAQGDAPGNTQGVDPGKTEEP